MKRHPALQDLSRDHFHVLFRCQRFRRMLSRGAGWEELRPMVEEFLVFYEADMSPHFQEEDELVVPEALRAGAAGLKRIARKIGDEHQVLRTLIGELLAARGDESAVRALLGRLEPMITRHVQEEESELFEGVQAALSGGEMEELGRRSAVFRAAHRAPDVSGPRKGRG